MDPESTGILGILEMGVSITRLLHSLLSKTQKIAGEKQTNPKKKKKRGYERWSGRKARKTINLVTRGCQTMGRGGDGTKPNNKTKTAKREWAECSTS
jgi:hypothetical protein